IHAIGDTCTHGDISLSEGFVEGDTVECWAHGSAARRARRCADHGHQGRRRRHPRHRRHLHPRRHLAVRGLRGR
ncbi:hypothetical protein CTI14_66795, partial [Methylobacterium radiotolerans]